MAMQFQLWRHTVYLIESEDNQTDSKIDEEAVSDKLNDSGK